MVLLINKKKTIGLPELFMQLLVSLMLLFFSQTAFTENPEARHDAAITVVDRLHASLLELMQVPDSMSFTERYAKLELVITQSFDTPVIAKVILSRYWNELSDQQQADFIHLFNRQSVATYVSRFNGFNGEVFKIKTVEELKKGRLLVRTEIQSTDESPVNLDYLMHENNGNWYIISVIANGVNDLSLKRAEYSAIIKDSGYQSLVSSIETKVTELEKKPEN